jgi:hypothetical protein
VLKLEFSLEEEEGRVIELQQQLQQSQQREREAVRAAAAAASTAAAAGSAPSSSAAAGAAADVSSAVAGMGAPGVLPAINTSPPLLGIFDACSDDGWASTPTVDVLLPKIVALWEELYVPLAYRSRFFLSFRGREVFYYEVEARRLEWKRSQMLAGATEESSWAEQQSSNASHLGRGSYSYGEGGGPGTPTAGRGTPRPMTSASAAAALTASSSFGGIRRRSRQLDKAARWVVAADMSGTATDDPSIAAL